MFQNVPKSVKVHKYLILPSGESKRAKFHKVTQLRLSLFYWACTTKIMGVLNSDQDCPLDIPNCHLNVHVENNGEDYYTLTTLGSFDMPVCPGDKLFLSAHWTLAEDHTFFYACEVSNGELDMGTIMFHNPSKNIWISLSSSGCHRSHDYLQLPYLFKIGFLVSKKKTLKYVRNYLFVQAKIHTLASGFSWKKFILQFLTNSQNQF